MDAYEVDSQKGKGEFKFEECGDTVLASLEKELLVWRPLHNFFN